MVFMKVVCGMMDCRANASGMCKRKCIGISQDGKCSQYEKFVKSDRMGDQEREYIKENGL